MRLLGIDYGTKRVGVAIGDSEGRVAVPFEIIENANLDAVLKKIQAIIEKEKIELVVVGQGGKGSMEEKVQEFVEQLKKHVPVEIADEHFTTVQIERTMKDYGKDRNKIDKDSAAAALILQGWLDSSS